jgi:hypothetical protein
VVPDIKIDAVSPCDEGGDEDEDDEDEDEDAGDEEVSQSAVLMNGFLLRTSDVGG